MVSDPTPALQGSDDSRASSVVRADHLEALIADLRSQHARYLTVLEEALSASAQVRRQAAEEAARVLASARQDADRLRGEAVADREAAREERARLAAARAQAEEALAHTRHALSAITAPLPDTSGQTEAPGPKQDDLPPPPSASAAPGPRSFVQAPDKPPALDDGRPIAEKSSSSSEIHTTTEPERHLIGNRVLFAAVVPPCLLLLGVFASMAWRGGSANSTARPLQTSQLPPLSYQLVSAPVSRPPLPEPSAFTITAARPTWLRLTVDGKRGPGFVLAPGTPRGVAAERDLIIRTGDAGAISVSIAGRPPVAMGANGQVVSRQYHMPGPAPVDHPKPAATTGGPPRAASLSASLASEPVRMVSQAVPPLRLATAPPAVSPVALPPAAPPTTAPRTEAAPDADLITTAARRWLTAFTRGDGRAVADLTAPGFELLDERPEPRRFSANQQAERSLADPEVSVSGDGAVLSARIIERVPGAGPASSDPTAYMSQVWIRQSGSWRLLGVRIRGADQVERMFRR
jgi:hypothetical protein